MQTPLVSIGMITYNHEKYIREAIDGVLMQKTNFQFELVIGEDFSSDNTNQICKEYAKTHSKKINLLPSTMNHGMLPNFVRTLEACHGKYIALCEGDDYWTDPYKLQKQVDFLEQNPEYSICSHNVEVLSEETGQKIEWLGKKENNESTIRDLLSKGSGGATCSLVFRNYHFRNLREWFQDIQGGDWALQILLTTKGKMFYFNEVMGVYRRHDGGISSSKNDKSKLINIFYEGGVLLAQKLNKKLSFRYNDEIEENLINYFYPNLISALDTNNKNGDADYFRIKRIIDSNRNKHIPTGSFNEVLKILNLDLKEVSLEDYHHVIKYLVENIYFPKQTIFSNVVKSFFNESFGKGLFIGNSFSELPEFILDNSISGNLYCLHSEKGLGKVFKQFNKPNHFKNEQIEKRKFVLSSEDDFKNIGNFDFIVCEVLLNDVYSILDNALKYLANDAKIFLLKKQLDPQISFELKGKLSSTNLKLVNETDELIAFQKKNLKEYLTRETEGFRASFVESEAWSETLPVTASLISKYNVLVSAEIGVARGHHSAHLLESFSHLKHYSVDPWKHFELSYDDPANAEQALMDKQYGEVKNLLSKFGERSKIIRKTSLEASKEIMEKLDFIFIDANHSYESVKEDLHLWWDKVKPGGIVAGQDYMHPNFPGVKLAVDEYLVKYNLSAISEQGSVWWVQKPFNHFLTFIIPCYNCSATISESIDSIINQRLEIPYEIVCTDDCSTDNTVDILKSYSKKYPFINILNHDQNKGGAAARNTCVRNSKGDLIFCLDSDNVLEANSISRLIALLDEKKVAAASFQELKYFKENISNVYDSWIFEAPDNVCGFSHIIMNIKTPPASGNYLFTKESWEKANGYPEGSGAMDAWGFGFRQLATGTKIAILPNSFYYHRVTDNSYWTRENRLGTNDINASKIMREHLDLFNSHSQNLLYDPESQKKIFSLIEKKVFKTTGFSDTLKVHVGCGPRILKGWINIDLAFEPFEKYLQYYTNEFYGAEVRGSKDEFIALDVTKEKLPFLDNTVDFIFDEDFIEHLTQKEQVLFLAETFRALKPGGIHRVTTPNLSWIMKNNSDFSRGMEGVTQDCWNSWGHKDLLSPKLLKELAEMVGFELVVQERGNCLSEFIPKEYRPDPKTGSGNESHLYADLIKPSQQTKEYRSEVKMVVTEMLGKELSIKNQPLKLHLGCGEKYIGGYVNIDYPPSEHSVQTKTKVDYYSDITKLSFGDNSVDEIRLHHVFEHFPRPQALALLVKWSMYLKIGGMLHIETPDYEACSIKFFDKNLSFQERQVILRHLFGSHEEKWAVHYDGWYRDKFVYILKLLGYEKIEIVQDNWKLTYNITVKATKSINYTLAEYVQSVKNILQDNMVDNSESEKKLLQIWINSFEQELSNTSDENKLVAPPKVSIFMPTYNRSKYIGETIDSLLAQTFSNFELIIADDGSTDNTIEIINRFASRDKRVRLLKLNHAGEVNARNEAIKIVNINSKYLLNHDSDDISLPNKLEQLVNFLDESPQVAIVGCEAEYFDDEGKHLGKPEIYHEPEDIRKTFSQLNSMINSAALIRKEVFNSLKGYREEFRGVDDYDFFARALVAGFNLVNLPNVLHKIRLHPGAIGSTRAEEQQRLAAIIKEYYNKSIPQPIQIFTKSNEPIRKNKLRILATVEFYNPHIGGAEVVVQKISEGLANRGHEITVATTLLPERNFDQLNGVKIVEFDVAGNFARGLAGNDVERYIEFTTNENFDVMFNYAAQQWATDLAFKSAILTREKRVNIIAPCGYSALTNATAVKDNLYFDYFNDTIPAVFPFYDASVYHSSIYQDYEFAKNHGFSNSLVIPNGVTEEEFLIKPKINFREKYSIKSKYIGLCVANYYEGKGQERIVDVVKKMNRPDFEMIFIGKEGKTLKQLQQLAEGLNVKFLTNISREDTLAAYHEADLFLFASHFEVFPLVILEAKASKTPFVSVDCGNVKELKGGIVSEVNDLAFNVSKLLDDEKLRMRMAVEGFNEWKNNYTWDAIINKYENLFMMLSQSKQKGLK
ncbi:MAG: glycosyltransferase [Melioribacteraceae bacterium]